MAGFLVETVSNKKLIAFSVVLFLVQIVLFLVGGLISPIPNNVQMLVANACHNPSRNKSAWFARGEKSCENPLNAKIGSSEDWLSKHSIKDGREIVFSWKFPLMKDGVQLYMSPWHQNMIAMIRIDFDLNTGNANSPDDLVFDVRLGYRDVGQSDWMEFSKYEGLKRALRCGKNATTVEDNYSCDLIPLFELGSTQYDEYLINVVFPSEENKYLGKIDDVWAYIIHQNGGFTFVWFTIKTIFFPILALALVWYIWKLSQLNRKPNILERTLLAVGAAITLLNFPVDWLTLWLDLPFMLLYSDIRQGLFYSVLLCFWVVFSGEHRMDQVKRDNLKHYGWQLGAVAAACVCMFLFDICERGVQLSNPFFSIWSTKTGSNIALFFVILAGISAGVYLIYLLVSIAQVFKNICIKRSALPGMSKPRQKYYKNLIYRFSFLMALTILCASMTIVMFILGQIEDDVRMLDVNIHFASAVQTGVYGMWNIYVFCLLILYSPSLKYTPLVPIETSTEENVEFSAMPSETAALKTFMQKSALE